MVSASLALSVGLQLACNQIYFSAHLSWTVFLVYFSEYDRDAITSLTKHKHLKLNIPGHAKVRHLTVNPPKTTLTFCEI